MFVVFGLKCEFHKPFHPDEESNSGRETIDADLQLFLTCVLLVLDTTEPNFCFRVRFQREWTFSGRGEDLCHCVATEGKPGCVAAARPAGTTENPACSPSRSAALFS